MPQSTYGRLKNREKVRLECRNCVKAQFGGENCAGEQCTRNKYVIVCMRRKSGELTRNIQHKVSMGDNGKFPKMHHVCQNNTAPKGQGDLQTIVRWDPKDQGRSVKFQCRAGGGRWSKYVVLMVDMEPVKMGFLEWQEPVEECGGVFRKKVTILYKQI